MTGLEKIIKQQQQLDKLVPKSFISINSILEKQHHFQKLFSYPIMDLAKFNLFEKVYDIKHIVPITPSVLNYDNFIFDDTFLDISNKFKWLKEFDGITKDYSQFYNFFKSGQHYKFVERDFSELYEDFNDSDLKNNEEETTTSVIITETQRVKEIIKSIYVNNQKIFSIHPREFEKIIAELLYNQGFDVELTKQTRDNGYDIMALKYIDNFSPIKYLVECKRYSEKNKVGVEIIRSFKEVIATEQANKGIIVTSSYFTKDAINKQKETPYLLDYKDKDEVINWIDKYMNTTSYR